MQQGTIVALHIARVKGTPSDPVKEASAISAAGLDGDRSCNPDNTRQVLIMDRETLDKFGLEQIGRRRRGDYTSGTIRIPLNTPSTTDSGLTK